MKKKTFNKKKHKFQKEKKKNYYQTCLNFKILN